MTKPQPTSKPLEIVSSDDEANTITALVKGVPYIFQYHVRPDVILYTTHKMMSHSPGKALFWMTRKAFKVTKVTHADTSQ